METMANASILAVARARWEAEGVRFREGEHTLGARWHTEHGPVEVTVVAGEEERLLQVLTYATVRVPAPARLRVVDLLNRINWKLCVWSFELDPDRGTICLRACDLVQDAATLEGVLEQLVEGCLEQMVEYLPAIYRVAFGGSDPAEALAALREAARRQAARALN